MNLWFLTHTIMKTKNLQSFEKNSKSSNEQEYESEDLFPKIHVFIYYSHFIILG